MKEEPKESILPFALGGGVLLVCCLGSVLLASGGAGLTAWTGGIAPLLAIGIAVAVLAAAIIFRRVRVAVRAEAKHSAATHTPKGIL